MQNKPACYNYSSWSLNLSKLIDFSTKKNIVSRVYCTLLSTYHTHSVLIFSWWEIPHLYNFTNAEVVIIGRILRQCSTLCTLVYIVLGQSTLVYIVHGQSTPVYIFHGQLRYTNKHFLKTQMDFTSIIGQRRSVRNGGHLRTEYLEVRDSTKIGSRVRRSTDWANPFHGKCTRLSRPRLLHLTWRELGLVLKSDSLSSPLWRLWHMYPWSNYFLHSRIAMPAIHVYIVQEFYPWSSTACVTLRVETEIAKAV